LKQITDAGGTDKTYLVEGGNVSEQSLGRSIKSVSPRRSVVNCRFRRRRRERPSTSVSSICSSPTVAVSAPPSTTLAITPDARPAGGGWYYDDPARPSKILLCESTCKVVKSDMDGQLDYAIGCKTIIPPPR
jgi:hypothetical protein